MPRISFLALLAALALGCLLRPSDGAGLEVPSWVRINPQVPRNQEDLEDNAARVRAADKANQTYNLMLYGDSITRWMYTYKEEVWDKVFPRNRFLAAPFAMGGSSIQELAWRLVKNDEVPRNDPKVVAVMIGYINVKFAERLRDNKPWEKAEWLMKYIKQAMPKSKLVIVACTPNKWVDMSRYNKQMAVAAARNGALFVDCNKSVANIKSKTLYRDGTHLAPGGQKVFLQCLHKALAKFM